MFNIISHYTEENFVKLGNVFLKNSLAVKY